MPSTCRCALAGATAEGHGAGEHPTAAGTALGLGTRHLPGWHRHRPRNLREPRTRIVRAWARGTRPRVVRDSAIGDGTPLGWAALARVSKRRVYVAPSHSRRG